MRSHALVALSFLLLPGVTAGLYAGTCTLSNGQAADLVEGQPDFITASVNSGITPSGVTMNSPRKSFTDGTRLFVGDTENNRVLIYNSLPTGSTQAPSLVLGQAGFSAVSPNRGASVASNTMDFAHGVYYDGTRLYVADYHNNRVLIWNSLPSSNGQAADLVLGQANFTSNAINRTGSTSVPSAGSLYWPSYIWGDGTRVVVADTYNQRVLIWNSFPSSNGQNADVVVGQSSFIVNGSACGPASLNFCHQASIEGGKLIVTDTNNHRYLIWNSVPVSNGASADVVVGQTNLFSCSPNGAGAGDKNVSWAVGYTVDASGAFWIADYGNHRVLRFPSVPASNAPAADLVLGQANFSGVTVNRTGSTTVASADSLNWPYGVTVGGGRLWITEYGNSRVLSYACPATTPTVTATSSPTPSVTPVLTPTTRILPIRVEQRKAGDPPPCKIFICSHAGGRCSVQVHRPEGRLCRRLWEGDMSVGETKVLFWYDDDDGGQRVSSGIYPVVFRDGDGTLHKSMAAIIR
jgi:hypothetical protein